MGAAQQRADDDQRLIAIPLTPGWFAVPDIGGWRGVSEDGTQTPPLLTIEAVMRAIAAGWLVGVESVVAPSVTHSFRRRSHG